MYDSKILSERIKVLILEKKLKIGDVLCNCGLNKDTLSTMNKGSMIQADRLAKIADYLNVSVDYLLGRDENVSTGVNINGSDNSITNSNINSPNGNIHNSLSANEQQLLEKFRECDLKKQNKILTILFEK